MAECHQVLQYYLLSDPCLNHMLPSGGESKLLWDDISSHPKALFSEASGIDEKLPRQYIHITRTPQKRPDVPDPIEFICWTSTGCPSGKIPNTSRVLRRWDVPSRIILKTSYAAPSWDRGKVDVSKCRCLRMCNKKKVSRWRDKFIRHSDSPCIPAYNHSSADHGND